MMVSGGGPIMMKPLASPARGLWALALLATLSSATLAAPAPSAQTQAALATLDAFMAAFNARDIDAFEATFHFPHVRMASGKVTVLPTAGTRSAALFEALAATGWHHSAWLERKVVQAGPGKVHLAVRFARYDEAGAVLREYESLYIVERRGDRWGIVARSSYAP